MSEHKLHWDLFSILKPVEDLPDAKPGQSILVVESAPKSSCGFTVEQYYHHPKLKPDSKGWKGHEGQRHPMVLFHGGRGKQRDRILGWVWVTK